MAGVSPLYVLLSEMRRRWKNKEYDAAVGLAKVAAPYLHGRAATSRSPGDLSEVPDDELDAWAALADGPDGGSDAEGGGEDEGE